MEFRCSSNQFTGTVCQKCENQRPDEQTCSTLGCKDLCMPNHLGRGGRGLVGGGPGHGGSCAAADEVLRKIRFVDMTKVCEDCQD